MTGENATLARVLFPVLPSFDPIKYVCGGRSSWENKWTHIYRINNFIGTTREMESTLERDGLQSRRICASVCVRIGTFYVTVGSLGEVRLYVCV